MKPHFRASLRELHFFLWELLRLDELLARPPFLGNDRASVAALLERGLAFANEMAASYASADEEGCRLEADGRVRLPTGFAELWQRWIGWDDLGAQADGVRTGVIPPPAKQAVMEMLMGANPAFMCFGGFTPPATRLIRAHGTPAQRAALLPALEAFRWDACYCATESGAGSDLLAIASTGRPLDEDGEWAVQGEKLYITAGAHDLTENTLYIVLARMHDASADSMFLSCFLVPRYWTDARTGERLDNHVRCVEVPRKMGMKGCPNTRLRFGAGGASRAWLLGDRRNAGMLQFATLARHARVNSAIFATGLASTAYLNSVSYARHRIQGRRLHQSAMARAPRQPIIGHADVQRMLLDMKARLEASRSLVGRVTWLSAWQEAGLAADAPDQERIERWGGLARLLVPIAKTWTAEQAWKVCETAMQVHGGIGYTEHTPVEQYLRDVKILSIWEGTSYVQSLVLVRDVLGFGRSRRALDALRAWIEDTLRPAADHPHLRARHAAVLAALDDCAAVMAHLHAEVQAGRLDACSHHFTRIADMFGTTVGAWGLLEGASIALDRLAGDDAPDPAERGFYRGKVKAMDYFFDVLLPSVGQSRQLVVRPVADYQHIDADELACMDPA